MLCCTTVLILVPCPSSFKLPYNHFLCLYLHHPCKSFSSSPVAYFTAVPDGQVTAYAMADCSVHVAPASQCAYRLKGWTNKTDNC